MEQKTIYDYSKPAVANRFHRLNFWDRFMIRFIVREEEHQEPSCYGDRVVRVVTKKYKGNIYILRVEEL